MPSGSVNLELRPGNEGIIDEPDLFVLELIAHEPEIGDTQVVERQVSWEDNVGPEIERVRIQGAASTEIMVTEAV